MNRLKPTISIITPTFNRQQFLPRVWASLGNQTLDNFEWIIVDDGSTDASAEYIASLNDPRITYVYQENGGCNAARQRGEEEVQADFVVFLDSDDELYANETLETMVKAISNTPANIGVVAFTVLTPEGGGGHSRLVADEMILGYEDLIGESKVQGEVFRIFKRETLAVEPWWTEGRGMLSLRYFEIARHYQFLFINQPALIYHMNHGGNLTSAASTIKRAPSMVIGYEKLIERHREGWLRSCPKALGTNLFHAAMYCAIDGQTGKALSLSLESMQENGPLPNNLILILSLALTLSWRRKIFIWRSRLRGRS